MKKYNIPSQSTSFVGRTQEIAEISTRLNEEDCRLLTLLGAGGIGKTRLAIAVAEQQYSKFADGVYFIPLQAVASSELVLSSLADIMDFQFREGAAKEQFLQFLQTKQILLVLDNFEHLLDAADLLPDIVEASSEVKIMVTSREALNLQGEWLYHVFGMHFPQEGDEIESFSAVKLFAERARQVRRDFSLTDEADCVARICRLVEGMPLALELAAAWLKRLTCGDIADEIERNLDFLTTNLRGVPDRHRSIRAVFNHSWGLLSEDEQSVFIKMSVFHGGCTREAAQEVTGASLFILSDLVDKSLLRLSPEGRYEIHELLRQYASEKLDKVPEIREEALDKHCEYFMEFIATREHDLLYGWKQAVMQAISHDIDNILKAWQYVIDHRKITAIQKSIVSIGSYVERNNKIISGDLFPNTLELLRTENPKGEEGIIFAWVMGCYGWIMRFEGRYEQALQYCQDSVRILRNLGAERELMWSLTYLHIILFFQGDYQAAQKVAEEAYNRAEAIDDYITMNYAVGQMGAIARMFGHYRETEEFVKKSSDLNQKDSSYVHRVHRNSYLAEILQLRGEYKQAQHIMKEMLPIEIEGGHEWNIGQAYEWIGHIEHALGHYEIAEKNLLESLRYARGHGDPRRVAFSLVALGDLMSGTGDYRQAKEYYQEAINVAKPASQRWQESWALRGLGQVAHSIGDYQQAKSYAQESLKLCDDYTWVYGTVQANNVLGMTAVTQNDRDAAAKHFYEALSSNLVVETPPVILASLYGIARLAASEGDLEQAVELLSLILSNEKTHADTKHLAQAMLEELQAELAQDSFEAAFKCGQNSDLEDVVEAVKNQLSAQEPKQSSRTYDGLVEGLSEREIEVLHLVAAGRSNREIAAELYLALGTVKTHIHNVCGKLGATNRTEAVALAREKNIL